SSSALLRNLCAARRLLPLLGMVGLLAGTAAGAWLLVKHLQRPPTDLGFTSPQEAGAIAVCNGSDKEEPVVSRAPGTVSFRINPENSLLEVQMESRPGWLLACHERWEFSLGTRLCRQLGYLRCVALPGAAGPSVGSLAAALSPCRMNQQKAVNVTDIRLDGAQQFAQIRPEWGGRLQDMWQIRSACESGWVVALKCSGKCSLPWRLPRLCTGARGPWLTSPGRPAECGLRPGAARVLGGADAPRGRWPWQVSVQHGSQHRCGGSVLAPDWIVTAAHCVHSYRRRREASNWLVFAGVVTHGAAGQEAGTAVEKIIYHSLYDDKTLDYDIALMKLQAPLNFSDAVRAVCLPPARQDLLQGSYCWVSGWGYTSPQQAQITETLKEALVPLIGTKLCNSSCMYAGELTARMLCAGYPHGQIDACQGDSGGPLVCQDGPTWRLVGIVSWGQGCGEPNHPGVYTNVAQLLPWIHHITEVSRS
ncbi:TMPS5 protease, partial [Nothoprocta pentlandii]|nr:TMPS5 protease [Nothoprocta pentlandii]